MTLLLVSLSLSLSSAQVVEKEFISLNIDCANLKKFDAELYNVLVHYPEEVIPLSDLVATELATSVAKSMYGLRTPGMTPTTPNDDPLNGRRLQVWAGHFFAS